MASDSNVIALKGTPRRVLEDALARVDEIECVCVVTLTTDGKIPVEASSMVWQTFMYLMTYAFQRASREAFRME